MMRRIARRRRGTIGQFASIGGEIAVGAESDEDGTMEMTEVIGGDIDRARGVGKGRSIGVDIGLGRASTDVRIAVETEMTSVACIRTDTTMAGGEVMRRREEEIGIEVARGRRTRNADAIEIIHDEAV